MSGNDDLIASIIAKGKERQQKEAESDGQATASAARAGERSRATTKRWPAFLTEFSAMIDGLNADIRESGFRLAIKQLGTQQPGQSVNTKGEIIVALSRIGQGVGSITMTLNVDLSGTVKITHRGPRAMEMPEASLDIVESSMNDFRNLALRFVDAALRLG